MGKTLSSKLFLSQFLFALWLVEYTFLDLKWFGDIDYLALYFLRIIYVTAQLGQPLTMALFVTSPQTLFGREVLFYSCESVCGSVCDSVDKITQKVLDRF